MIKAEEMNPIGVRNLASAVVEQAAMDLYLFGRRLYLLQTNPDMFHFKKQAGRTYAINTAKRRYRDALNFLKSDDLLMFTNLSGLDIIKEMNKKLIKDASQEMITGDWPHRSTDYLSY